MFLACFPKLVNLARQKLYVRHSMCKTICKTGAAEYENYSSGNSNVGNEENGENGATHNNDPNPLLTIFKKGLDQLSRNGSLDQLQLQMMYTDCTAREVWATRRKRETAATVNREQPDAD